MDQVLQYNFGYLPPRAGLTSNLPLSYLASKRSAIFGVGADTKPSKKAKATGAASVLEQRCVDLIRVLAADMVQQANSGHPGAAMGCAPIAYLLWAEIMNYSPQNPKWANRDRFVLSNGHACALQYVMLHLTGYAISLDDLKNFRQLGSLTPGHPENHVTPGVEVATGPLGQGISNGVGLAMGQAHLAATFNKEGFELIDHYTYVICGDGCLQEGISSEASSLAGHLGLGRLIVMYDDNKIQIDGGTDLAFTEDVCKRYEAYGWQTIHVSDGDADFSSLKDAIEAAKKDQNRPTLIKVTTTIGFGSLKQGTAGVHGAPLGHADLAQVKRNSGFTETDFFTVPKDVAEVFTAAGSKGEGRKAAWDEMLDRYTTAHPELAAEFKRRQAGELPKGWKDQLPRWTTEDKALATRQSSQQVLNKICEFIPEMVGGSADLTPSNLTKFRGALDFQASTPEGRYIRFGVREHAMAAICNGLCAYGGLVPFCATFLNFTGYALGAMRVSALSEFGVIYIATHDSIGLGEDGPTHQPVEALLNFRATPNTLTIRPADSNECSGAYMVALERRHTPTVIACSRQGCANLAGSAPEKVELGAYPVVTPEGTSDLVLVGSGSEVQLLIDVAKALNDVKCTVISMPCWELFDKQPQEYRLSIFPKGVPVLSCEALTAEGWCKYSHYAVGMRSFGASGPAKDVQKKFGFTTENVTDKARKLLAYYADKAVPCLIERPDLLE